jgi:hypothetical protein
MTQNYWQAVSILWSCNAFLKNSWRRSGHLLKMAPARLFDYKGSGSMVSVVFNWFFPRKARIALFALMIYMALC